MSTLDKLLVAGCYLLLALFWTLAYVITMSLGGIPYN